MRSGLAQYDVFWTLLCCALLSPASPNSQLPTHSQLPTRLPAPPTGPARALATDPRAHRSQPPVPPDHPTAYSPTNRLIKACVSFILRPSRPHSNERGVHCRPARPPLEGRASLIRICASFIRPPARCDRMLWRRSQGVSSIGQPIRAHSNERGFHCRPARRPLGGRASPIRRPRVTH